MGAAPAVRPARPHGERFNTLRFTPRELARGFNYHFGVITLYVMSAVTDADVICGREVGRYFVLEARGQCPGGRCFTCRPTCARQDDSWNTCHDRTFVHLFAPSDAVIDFATH